MNKPLHRGPLAPTVVSRRQFLSMLGLTGATVALPSLILGDGAEAAARKKSARVATSAKGNSASTKVVAGRSVPGPRVLIVLEMQGGNDGFSMLIPSGNGRFRQLRDKVWLDPKDMQAYGDGYSIAKGLGPVAAQLAFIEGVGVAKPELSHTEMMTRWWQGDPDGTGTYRSGFLGRCCDAIPGDAAIAGVSIGGGSTPALISERAATVALPEIGSLRELIKDDDSRMRPALTSLTDGGDDGSGLEFVDRDLLAKARAGLSSGLSLLGGLGGLSDANAKSRGYPDGNLAEALALAHDLVSLNAGIRVIHVPWGSFDTHTGQRWSHPDQMRQLGSALGAFRNDIVRSGLTERVLVATTSEFGRRPEANAGGTDHGTASTMLILGPVRPGRQGAPVDFNRLDRAGNASATVSMNDYYATLASWLGAPIAAGSPLTSLGVTAA